MGAREKAKAMQTPFKQSLSTVGCDEVTSNLVSAANRGLAHAHLL